VVNWPRLRLLLSVLSAASLVAAGVIYVPWFIQPLIVFSGSARGSIWFLYHHVTVFGDDVRLSIAYALKVYSVPIAVMASMSVIAGLRGLTEVVRNKVLNGSPLWFCVLASQVSVTGSGYAMGVATIIHIFASYMTRDMRFSTSAGRVIFPPIVASPGWVVTPLVPILSYVFTIASVMSLLILVWSLEREGLLSSASD